jgi:hypothetical protein
MGHCSVRDSRSTIHQIALKHLNEHQRTAFGVLFQMLL